MANHLFAIDAVAGTINIHGGNITAGSATGNTFVDFYSGIEAEGGVVNIKGTGFDFPYGAISATSGILTGTLADGTPLNLSFNQVHPGEIILIPEPGAATLGALALLLTAGGVLRRRRGRRQNLQCKPGLLAGGA